MLKLGIIGTGQISHEFIKAAKLSGHYELQAVYSRPLREMASSISSIFW